MSTYSAVLSCPGTSMTANVQATVTAVARVDNSGWDVTHRLYLRATNSSGFPFKGSGPTGYLDVGGTRRVTFSGGYDFPSGHGTGYEITLGGSSYFLPVTSDGKGSLAVAFGFTDSGGSLVLGSNSGTGSFTLPDIPVGPKIRDTTWKSGIWKTQQSTLKSLILKVWDSGAWKNLS